MPLNAGGDAGYGSVAGPGLSGSEGASEAAPLLVPADDADPPRGRWRPMSKDELELRAGGPGWRRLRCYLVLLFWLAWVSMLAVAVAIIVKSPKPVVTSLKWWQRSLFYQLTPGGRPGGSEVIDGLCEELPYFKSLGIDALILEGFFDKHNSPLNVNVSGESLGTLHLITESNKAGLKVVLDFCELELLVPHDEEGNAEVLSETLALHAIQFWLERGVAGFAICDTDVTYSEKTLLAWKRLFKEFSSPDEERIVIVKQTAEVLSPLANSSQINVTLVDMVMGSILPAPPHLLTAQEMSTHIQTRLQDSEDVWPSWRVGDEASNEWKKLLLVLLMTLPGSPVIQYDQQIVRRQNISQHGALVPGGQSASTTDKDKLKRSTIDLFISLSHSKAREEALLYGTFNFLAFNVSSSTNASLPDPSPHPVLAFLRSWGCVHFLVLLNTSPETCVLDPGWAPGLPEAGVFVSSTEMDRLGSTSILSLALRPHEAVVIKLFEMRSFS